MIFLRKLVQNVSKKVFFLSRNVPNFKMADIQSTFNQGTTSYTGTPTGTFKPTGKCRKKKKIKEAAIYQQ